MKTRLLRRLVPLALTCWLISAVQLLPQGTQTNVLIYVGGYDTSASAYRTATATATVVNGFVVGITVTDGGAGYDNTRPPVVTIDGGGGSGATAEAVVGNGTVTQVKVLTAGAGYTTEPVVSIAEPPSPPRYAPPEIKAIAVVPRLVIQSEIGMANEIEYSEAATPSQWHVLTNLVVTQSPYVFIDVTAPLTKRFYRVVSWVNDIIPNTNTPAGMVWIPNGRFTMGSPLTEADRDPSEGPQTQVMISQGFWMSRYETTQEEYLSVMGSSPSSFKGDLKRPVESVSWNDAMNYCGELTARERTAGRLPTGYEYRLPTEAEWEYACRAGTTTRFSYGNDPNYAQLVNYGWVSLNGANMTHPVGQKQPNSWGLCDMYGNVWEWCLDWYGTYPGESVTDPRGPTSGPGRVIRGGSWDLVGSACRSAVRNAGTPGYRILNIGFRPVLAPGQ